ncbi:hypothetical protein RWH43_10680 [Microbacterium sp. KSW2-21]|uniref:Uncharacterized protein n=1 Tax=Microbacterium algihabitans TaxID=3075992 RepID=A0ABU3RWG4_9MICO|nr:hypothetical protein [Microbacterium sp. KSW2-21]MDU0327219.1 hypothetical protein [Microbacterium sp. KSW2-21]
MTGPKDWHVEAPEQQSRFARLCLAKIESDGLQAVSVFDELMSDPRGERTATQALLQTFVDAMVDTWSQMGALESAAVALRAGLLDMETDQ